MRGNLRSSLKYKLLEYLRKYSTKIRKSNRFNLPSANLVCYGFEPQTDLIGFYGGPEREEFEASLQFLKENKFDLVNAFDIGANIGITSLYLSSVYEQVHSFEPHPISFQLLELNSKLSKSQNIKTNNFGLSNKNGIEELIDWNPYHVGQSGIDPKKILKERYTSKNFKSSSYDIKCITLDDYIKENKIKNVSLLKIDAEGHEMNILKGAKETIKRFSPPIIFEDWETRLGKESELRNILRSFGYDIFMNLENTPPNLLHKSNFINNTINTIFKLIYIFLKGNSKKLETNNTSREFGYEHVLTVKLSSIQKN